MKAAEKQHILTLEICKHLQGAADLIEELIHERPDLSEATQEYWQSYLDRQITKAIKDNTVAIGALNY